EDIAAVLARLPFEDERRRQIEERRVQRDPIEIAVEALLQIEAGDGLVLPQVRLPHDLPAGAEADRPFLLLPRSIDGFVELARGASPLELIERVRGRSGPRFGRRGARVTLPTLG